MRKLHFQRRFIGETIGMKFATEIEKSLLEISRFQVHPFPLITERLPMVALGRGQNARAFQAETGGGYSRRAMWTFNDHRKHQGTKTRHKAFIRLVCESFVSWCLCVF